jgi:NitT/TauT family transport system ATP-binding protein
LVDDIYARMTARPVQSQAARDGVFPGTGIAMVLPHVSTNTLAGLIEEVDGTPFNGKASMAELADSLNFEIDDLFPMAETLQLLRFAELRGRTAADARRAPLCPSRCRSAQGDVRRGTAGLCPAGSAYPPHP